MTGPAHAAFCEADGEHLHQGLLQLPSSFRVQTRDVHGQRLRRGGDRLRVTARGPGPLRPLVTDRGDGRYDVSYVATLSGTYELSITCNSVPIRGSPFSVRIEPGCAHAPSCTVEAEGIGVVVLVELGSLAVRHRGLLELLGRPALGALPARGQLGLS